MISVEATIARFGYHPDDLSPRSHKKVVDVCPECGRERTLSKHIAVIVKSCRSCAQKQAKKRVTDGVTMIDKPQPCYLCGRPSIFRNGSGRLLCWDCNSDANDYNQQYAARDGVRG